MLKDAEAQFTITEAKIKYASGDYTVLSSGGFVYCALSGEKIPLNQLRYWNADLQEAYATAAISLKRYQEACDL
ncbi:MAG: hypothetical protein CMF31_04115 [Kordiimonas sp.]|nr:hypothetical protein [Kordiimonas sp.]|tara:strand:- start:11099 stop:11320 length:222 start_codon:yes stop_codon:yes gene_type:complete